MYIIDFEKFKDEDYLNFKELESYVDKFHTISKISYEDLSKLTKMEQIDKMAEIKSPVWVAFPSNFLSSLLLFTLHNLIKNALL